MYLHYLVHIRLIIHSGGQPWVGFILLASFFPRDSMFFHVFPWDLSGPWLHCCRFIIQKWSSKICRCRSMFSRWNRRGKKIVLRLFQHNFWNTPLNLYQQAISRDSFHSSRTGDCLGCALGVWNTLWGERWGSFFSAFFYRVDLDRRGHPQIGLLGQPANRL